MQSLCQLCVCNDPSQLSVWYKNVRSSNPDQKSIRTSCGYDVRATSKVTFES